jgi:predicted AAA+ superfamily ATPase
VLLTGARGTGKSSVVKAILSQFSQDGLRIVEVDKEDLVDLPQITLLLRGRPERFVVFCDDLSFEAGDVGYKALKVVLDGSLAATSDNILVYATSNRRHLLPEFMTENLETQHLGGEIRPGDTIEEKTSLSDRFGIWLEFYSFDQDEYLLIAAQWLRHFGIKLFDEAARTAALQWSHTRGSRSGRIAYQFARDFAGRKQLETEPSV